MQKFLFLPFLFIILILFPTNTAGKKVSFHLPVKESKEEKKASLTTGSFKVDFSSPDDEENSEEMITFSGFDKKLNSSTESFFITNKTERLMTGVEISIEYLTPDGRQLHKSFHEVKCHIPAGETRKVDIKSWDSQHSFYYVKSAPARGGGAPFIVRFSPIAYYLHY